MRHCLPTQVIAVVAILGLLCPVLGCATLTPETIAGWIELATEAWETYQTLYAEYQTLSGDSSEGENEDELGELESRVNDAWDAFERLRDRVNGGATKGMKAVARSDIYQGPAFPLHAE